MKTIYKYILDTVTVQRIKVPRGFRLLSVGVQNGQVCIWAEVYPETPIEYFEVYTVETGSPLDESFVGFEFIGTVRMVPFVWHIYGRAGS